MTVILLVVRWREKMNDSGCTAVQEDDFSLRYIMGERNVDCRARKIPRTFLKRGATFACIIIFFYRTRLLNFRYAARRVKYIGSRIDSRYLRRMAKRARKREREKEYAGISLQREAVRGMRREGKIVRIGIECVRRVNDRRQGH